MGGTHERMPDADKKAFVAELRAFVAAKPNGTSARLARLAGATGTIVQNVLKRESVSAPVAQKLRAAMKQLEADPNAGWVPRGQGAVIAKKAALAKERPKSQMKKSERGPVARPGWLRLAAEQSDLRNRVQAFFEGNESKLNDTARKLGVSNDTLKYFLKGRALRPKMLAIVTEAVHGSKAERSAAIVKAKPMQVALPGIAPPTNGTRVQMLTARLDASKVPPAPTGEAVIVDQFIRKVGIEALEALLQIAKARQEGDPHG